LAPSTPNLTDPKGLPRELLVQPVSGGGFGVRHLMYIVLVSALLCWAGIFFGVIVLVVAIVVGPAIVIGVIVGMLKLRSTRQQALLSVLAIASGQGMPLVPGTEAFADLCGGRYRRRVLALAHWLEQGLPLPEALRKVPGVVPRDTEVIIRVGWDSGVLGEALRQVAISRKQRLGTLGSVVGRIAYFLGLLMVIQGILGFILGFIAPRFERIFQDFNIRLPELTRATIDVGHVVIDSLALPVVVLMELALLIYLPLAYFGWVEWGLPFADLLFRQRHSAVVLRALAMGVEGNRPLIEVVETLARYYPRTSIRRRLVHAYHDLHDGADWLRSLPFRGLISANDAAVLAAAQRVGNLSWALRELADSGERRLGYRITAWSQVLFPIVIIAMGALVFTIAVAYFAPLVRIIEELGGP
jgi:type II secretory pathway component PulF